MGSSVTTADHDAGFKEIEVTLRNGTRQTIRLTAPTYRQAQQLALNLQQTKDISCVTAACLSTDNGPVTTNKFLDRLTLESASLVESISFALTFGDEFQKKMAAFGQAMLRQMDSTDSAPKSKSSAPVIPPEPSGNSACPNCGFITGSAAKPGSSPTSVQSTSAPPPA